MRNQLQTWFLASDEHDLSQLIRIIRPTLFFIDRENAGEPDVVAHTDLQDCVSEQAWIWDAATDQPDLAIERWRECVRHKSTGATVQFCRSRMIHERLVDESLADVLLSGRVAACFRGKGTDQQIELKRIIYKAVDSISSSNILPVSPASRKSIGSKCRGFRVGRHAAEWCKSAGNLLRHSATQSLYCLPAGSIETAEH